MFTRTKIVLPALVASLFVGAVGCESDNDDVRRRDRDRISDRPGRYDRERVDIDRDRVEIGRDRIGSNRDPILAGDRQLAGIPRNARRVDSAQGTSEMMYQARRDATIYVYDADTEKVVYTGSLRNGDRFVLDPNDNLALINGKKVLDRDLKAQHVFRLYVLEDEDRARY